MDSVSLSRKNAQNFSRPAIPEIGGNRADEAASVRSSLLFAGLPEQAITEIAACARARTFAKDETLFIQGQPVLVLILLQSGYVKHTQVGPNGTEVLLRFSRKGDIVEVLAESQARGHTCSAHAIEPCRALVWDHLRIAWFVTRYPQIGANISNILSRQLQELEKRFREMATERVEKRLSLALIRLREQIGMPSDHGTRISVRQEELAQMTGSTISTVSRVLSRWSGLGFVLPGRESIVIRDPHLLQGQDHAGSERFLPGSP